VAYERVKPTYIYRTSFMSIFHSVFPDSQFGAGESEWSKTP